MALGIDVYLSHQCIMLTYHKKAANENAVDIAYLHVKRSPSSETRQKWRVLVLIAFMLIIAKTNIILETLNK